MATRAAAMLRRQAHGAKMFAGFRSNASGALPVMVTMRRLLVPTLREGSPGVYVINDFL
jgi:hypothetical protein